MSEPEINEVDDASKAKQGKVTGIIIPPPDIRAVVDKTAQFVARNGKSFEQRILSSGEGKTAKFNFMKPFDPYHAYYEFKIREFEEGKVSSDAAGDSSAAGATNGATEQSAAETTARPSATSMSQVSTTTAKASITTPIARFAMNKPTSAPPPFEFSMGHPTGLSAVDADVIKLTAQYTAANGREFLSGLVQREQRNPQFDFLKPTHLLFSYFTSLVDAYSKVLQPSAEQLERIKEHKDRMKGLESAVQRWEWTRSEEERKKKENAEQDAEKSAFQAIDWHDFVVVETIDFPSDEVFEVPVLGLGMSSVGVGGASAASGTVASNGVRASSGAPPPPPPRAHQPADDDMDMEMDEDDEGDDRNKARLPPPPPPRPTATATAAGGGGGGRAGEDEEGDGMDMDDEEEEVRGGDSKNIYGPSGDEPMEEEEDVSDLKVVTDYRPRMATGTTSGPLTMVDPLSGKTLTVDEVGEHMRVQLLDPRYRIEQKRFQDKQRETGFAQGASIAESLKIFAKKRGDIFGEATPMPGAAAAAEEPPRKETVQWDGHMSSVPPAQQQKNELITRVPQSQIVPSSSASGPSISIGPTIPGLGAMQPVVVSVPPPLPVHVAPVPVAVPATVPVAVPPPPPAVSLYVAPTLVPAYVPPVPIPVAPVPVSVPVSLGYPVPPAPIAPLAAPIPLPHVPSFLPAAPSIPMPLAPALPPVPPAAAAAPYGAGQEQDGDEPDPKKPRQEIALVSAEEFAAQFPGPVSVYVSTPNDPASATWSLNGQTVYVSLSVLATVKDLKDKLAEQLGGMPVNKQTLKTAVSGFLKDTQTLAALNIGEGALVELSVKTRGGKR